MRRRRRIVTDAPRPLAGASVSAVDVLFENCRARYQQGVNQVNRHLISCPACGERHDVTRACRYLPHAHHPERNGAYSGTASVRTLPAGITGADLSRHPRDARKPPTRIRVGQVWASFDGHVCTIASVSGRFCTVTRCGRQVKVPCSGLLAGHRWRFLSAGAADASRNVSAHSQRERE